HPFMPFITEELWQCISERKAGESIMTELLPKAKAYDKALLANFESVKEIISGVRTIRLQKNIAQKEVLELQVMGTNQYESFNPAIIKMCNLTSISTVDDKADGSSSFIVGTAEYAVPLGNLIDVEAEIAKLEADLIYQEGFLQSVLKKLSNEKFVSKAPATVIDGERKKQADAESIINSLKENLENLKKA
ncbi:MAG: class I tRNA ligase family protein, partial [Bacteroides sp.]